jgi:pyruvate/2-oxoglutarate dehydrogenase complex dihydrolipoamide dehydrogenase (E3) component
MDTYDYLTVKLMTARSEKAMSATPRTCHAHPTLSEAVREAALAVDKRSIHI